MTPRVRLGMTQPLAWKVGKLLNRILARGGAGCSKRLTGVHIRRLGETHMRWLEVKGVLPTTSGTGSQEAGGVCCEATRCPVRRVVCESSRPWRCVSVSGGGKLKLAKRRGCHAQALDHNMCIHICRDSAELALQSPPTAQSFILLLMIILCLSARTPTP